MHKENKHQCLFCNTIFSRKGDLKKHEDSINKNITFDCQDCGKQFKIKGTLTIHINSVHKGIKYKCDQCDKEFGSVGGRYTQHISVILVIKNLHVHHVSFF